MLNSLLIKNKLLPLQPTAIMGIINLTPDSFFAGSRAESVAAAVAQAKQQWQEGAAILDLGAASSRPGAAEVSTTEEAARLFPALEAITDALPDAIVSVDTYRSAIAERALEKGAHIINDISGGEADTRMPAVIANANATYVLMHMRGTPATMAYQNQYANLLEEVLTYLAQRIDTLRNKGCYNLIADPGIGFAKNIEQNFELIKNISLFHSLEVPLLAGVSRKSLIWKLLKTQPEEALNGTTALHAHLLQQGVQLLRVHDVKEAIETRTLYLKTFKAIQKPEQTKQTYTSL